MIASPHWLLHSTLVRRRWNTFPLSADARQNPESCTCFSFVFGAFTPLLHTFACDLPLTPFRIKVCWRWKRLNAWCKAGHSLCRLIAARKTVLSSPWNAGSSDCSDSAKRNWSCLWSSRDAVTLNKVTWAHAVWLGIWIIYIRFIYGPGLNKRPSLTN